MYRARRLAVASTTDRIKFYGRPYVRLDPVALERVPTELAGATELAGSKCGLTGTLGVPAGSLARHSIPNSRIGDGDANAVPIQRAT
jgi:hypothetical protein